MALISCPECEKQISENAASCPNCGYLLTQEKVSKLKEEQKEREFFDSLETGNSQDNMSKPKEDKSKLILFKFFGFILLVMFVVYYCNSNDNSTDISKTGSGETIEAYPDNLTSTIVKNFAKQHPEYGNILGMSDMPDWPDGKRQEVRTGIGRYLFYLSGSEVVGVWKYENDGSRTQLFKKEISSLQTNSETKIVEGLPRYKILFQVNLFSGSGKYADILISSYNKNTPEAERESTLRKIIKKEGFVSAALYSTEDAYNANMSESFSKSHPNALKNGYLGMITESGIFTP